MSYYSLIGNKKVELVYFGIFTVKGEPPPRHAFPRMLL
jgi:hypothetical protein